MGIRPILPASAAVLVTALLACGAGEPAGGETSDEPAARLMAVPDLTIGTIEGEDAHVFGRIGGLALDPQGRIAVIEAQADEVRLFSPNGEFLFGFGGTGGGPGELRGPCCPAFGPDGRFWVRDGGNHRYNAYELTDAGARHVASLRMAHADVNRWAPTTFDPAGNLIDIGFKHDPGPTPPHLARFHLDSAAAVVATDVIENAPDDSLAVRTVSRRSAEGVSTSYLWQPFGPQHLVAHSRTGDWAEAISSRYQIAWRAPDGSLLRVIRRDVTGPELTPAERSRGEERLVEEAQRVGLARGDLPFGVPDRKPPLRELLFDRAGRLWIGRSVPEGQPLVIDVFERDGRYAAVVEWPAGVSLRDAYIAADAALAVSSDSLGVERVVRLRVDEVGATAGETAAPR